MKENVLVLGKGGREHALAWKISLSAQVEKVLVYPGNVGMTRDPGIEIVEEFAPKEEIENLQKLIRHHEIKVVVVGPEHYLAAGFSDALGVDGVGVVGCSQYCAQVESSKSFAKALMEEAGIPTASYRVLQGIEELTAYSLGQNTGIVIKRDGLAAGKGVFVCPRNEDVEQALDYLGAHHPEDIFVVEELLPGKEVSFFYLCCGEEASYLGHACDYKRLQDGDLGPNTGGMGCYSPALWLPSDHAEKVQKIAVTPLLQALKKRGRPFYGILFCGLMIEGEEIKVLEYNVRLGDPETQILMPLMEGDLFPWFQALANKDEDFFRQQKLLPSHKAGVHVVKAAAGYPGLNGPIEKGQIIQAPRENLPSLKVFFAGVAEREGELISAGGRVLGISAWGEDHQVARNRAYEFAQGVNFAGAQMRSDIGESL